MTKNNSRLGKGLSALFGEQTQSILDEIESGKSDLFKSENQVIKISDIVPNPYQPRREFDPQTLEELKQSIVQHGVISPILVRKSIVGYELIAGERRFRASKLANKETIPAVIVDFNDTEMMEISVIENIQREDLNVIDEAQAYQNLINKLGYTQEEVATKMNKSRSHITNLLRLLKLPTEVQQLVVDKKLSMGHVRPLITLSNTQQIIELANQAVEKHLSVRKMEQLAANPHPVKIQTKVKSPYDYPTQLLERRFQTKAVIKSHKIILEFKDTNDLNRILELMNALENE